MRILEYVPSADGVSVYIGDTFVYEHDSLVDMANVEVMLDGERIALKRFQPALRTASAELESLPLPPPWLVGGLAGGAGLVLVGWGLRRGAFVLVRERPWRAATALGSASALACLTPAVAWAGGAPPNAAPPDYYFELADPLGTGLVMLDDEGNRVRHQVFTPFGRVHDEVGAGLRTYYAGHRRDEASGMFYMQARWFDPGSGRFLSVDPLIRTAAVPQSANPYSYIENNPVNGVDPSGAVPLGWSGPSGRRQIYSAHIVTGYENEDGQETDQYGNVLTEVAKAIKWSKRFNKKARARREEDKSSKSENRAAAESRTAGAELDAQVQALPSGSGNPGDPPAFSEVNDLLGPVSPGGLPRFAVERLRPFVPGKGLFNMKVNLTGFPFGGIFSGDARAQVWGTTAYFASGEYAPRSASGLALIGHESIHVTQYLSGGAGFVGTAAIQEVGARFSSGLPAYEAVAYRAQFAIRRGLGGR